MESEDIVIEDLKIPGKRGPFTVRVLDFDTAFDVMFNTDPNDQTPLMLRLAQVCLVNGKGEPVYGPKQIDKMKQEIRPGPSLMAIGMTAYRINKIEDLIRLNETTEEAEKNS